MTSETMRRRGLCVGYVVAHAVAHASAGWFEVTPGISLWYAPAGLALGLLVLLGWRAAPVVLAANLGMAWWSAPPVPCWLLSVFPVLITLNYALMAAGVRRWLGGRLLPGNGRETLGFAAVVAVAPLPVAVLGSGIYWLSGQATEAVDPAVFRSWVTSWWVGDASGILTVVPAVMVFVAPWLRTGRGVVPLTGVRVGGVVRMLMSVGGLVGMLLLVLAVPALREHSAFYLCFLPLMWISVRHGLPGATLATLLLMAAGLAGLRLMESPEALAQLFLLFMLAAVGVGLGLGTLVTRRDEAERRLAESRERLDRVIEGAQLGLWDLRLPDLQVEVNERFASMIGHRTEEILPLAERWPALIHPADAVAVRAAIEGHVAGESPLFETEFRLRAKSGQWRWMQSRGSVVASDAQGRPLRVSGTQLDVTARKRAEAEVARLLRIIEATPDVVLMVDEAGVVVYANAALLGVCGRPQGEVAGLSLGGLLGDGPAAVLLEDALPVARARGVWRGEGTLVDAAGGESPVSQVVLAHRDPETEAWMFSITMRDMTVQRRAEAERRQRDRELLQVQKAESLGVMAGGIAHDFNNLLTAVMGNANLASALLPADSAVQAHIARIDLAATKAAALCQQMLAYAGRNPVAMEAVDVNRVCREACEVLSPNIRPRVRVVLELAENLPAVLAGATQIQQVVMNLILNAAESIGENPGRVRVRTSRRRLEAKSAAVLFPGATPPEGECVVLEVEDTGCGMSPEIIGRIFEPFFTTKFTGQGLGLAAVAGAVKAHRGAIAVESRPGEGTVFRVALPAQGGACAAAVAERAAAGWAGDAPPAAGRGLILVVDDNGFIRDISAQLLEGFGYAALLANDGVEGVELFRRYCGKLTAVMLDLTMPRMDGFEAHARMHELDPAVPVILMSGFSQKLVDLPPEAIHPAGVLAKPFGIAQLRARLSEVLGPPAGV